MYISEIEDIDAKASRGYDTCLRMRKTATTSRKQKGPEATEVERANRRRERRVDEGRGGGTAVSLSSTTCTLISVRSKHIPAKGRKGRGRESEREGGNTQEKLDSM